MPDSDLTADVSLEPNARERAVYTARRRLRSTLYFVCGLTDFAAFVVVFTVSRGLAATGAGPLYLGMIGAGFSFSAAVGSLTCGLLAHRLDSRKLFLWGALLIVIGIIACAGLSPRSVLFLGGYWSIGIGLGFLYPPLIGWLNQGESAHSNRRGVSRVLIVYCIAWNVGMMCGQLTGGTLFGLGKSWAYGAAISLALINLALAWYASKQVAPSAAPSASHVPSEQTRFELASAFKRLSWLANIGGMFGGSMVVHLLPDLAVSIGVPADDHGGLLACWRIVIISTYLLMHAVVFWHYNLVTAIVSQILGAGGLIVIAQADSSTTLLIGLAMLGQLVGYNYFSGLFYSTAGSSDHRRALAAGIHEATLAAGMALGTLVGGVLGNYVSVRSPYWLAAASVGALIVIQTVAWRRWVLPLRTAAKTIH